MDVCIYGMGRYGISTYYKLLKREINILCFGDQSIDKQGIVIQNIQCISFNEVLKLDKNKVVIIVAIKSNCRQVIRKFQESGFKFVCSYENLKDTVCENNSMLLLSEDQIQAEKKYLEQSIFGFDPGDKLSVSAGIEQMVDALKKRGRYENIRG